MPELWRTISVHERYEVSSLGRVRNSKTGRVLKLSKQVNGYLKTNLGAKLQARIHVLVCTAWHGPRPVGMLACHRNDIRTDNRPKNLYWGTPQQNVSDALQNDRYKRGEDCYQAKLTPSEVQEIRRLKQAEGLSYEKLAAMFNVNKYTIRGICKGRNWNHLT